MFSKTLSSSSLVILIYGFSGVLHGFTVSDPEPLSGSAGSSVRITGSGFDPDRTYTVKLGDSEVTVEQIQEDSIEVTLPANTESGFFTVEDGQQSLLTNRFFLVTAPLMVSYDNALGLDVSGYQLGTLYSSVDPQTGPEFVIQVDTAGPSLVMAAEDSDSTQPLYGIAWAGRSPLVLGAESTVEGFAFISSFFYTADMDELSSRLDHLRQQASYTSAVSSLRTHLNGGTDYLESASMSTLLEEMLLEFVNTYAGLVEEPETQTVGSYQQLKAGYDFSTGFENLRNGYPRELTRPGYHLLERVVAKPDVQVPNRRGLPVLKMKMDAAPVPTRSGDTVDGILKMLTANPLDWSANVYELDINDHRLDTPAEVDALNTASWSAVYDRTKPESIDRIIVPAKQITRYVDVLGLIKDQLKAKLLASFVNTVVPNPKALALKSDLTIPTEKPGIYMIRSFSGAAFPEQDALIDALPYGAAEDVRMMALNIILVVNDTFGFFVGQSNTIGSNEWAKFLIGLERNIGVTLQREAAQGTLGSEVLMGIAWEALKATNSWLVDKAQKAVTDIAQDALKGRFGRLTTFIGKALNVSAKVSSAGKVVERLAALTNAPRIFNTNARMALALEDTLLVVGDPWAPVIDTFEPKMGYRGTQITLYGDGFSTVPEENIVTFGRPGTSNENPPEATRGIVVYATETSLVVKVPEDADTGILTVTVPGYGSSTTADNDPPFDRFTIIPDPVITSSFPAMPMQGNSVRFVGTNFPTNSSIKIKSSSSQIEVIPTVVSSTEMFAIPPANVGEQTISILMNDREIGAFPINIAQSPIPPTGLHVTVNSTSDSNTRDDKISLREAIMLANGTLSVSSLTDPPTPRPSNTKYETDFVSGDQLGAAGANQIWATSDDLIVLASPLPPIGNYDLVANFSVDASGLSSAPIVIDGTTGANVSGNIYNPGQDGVLITGGASNNSVYANVINAGRHGVFVMGSANNNLIDAATTNPSQFGVYFSGENVTGNTLRPSWPDGINGPGQWGVVFDNGASFNQMRGEGERPVSGFTKGGVWISGDTTRGNFIGEPIDLNQAPNTYTTIRDNMGPGILIEGPATRVETANVFGNDGNGIHISGAVASGSRVTASRIGYDGVEGTESGNQGNGIYVGPGSRDVLIGSHEPISFHRFNSIGSSRDNGILIEGPGLENITVNGTTSGMIFYEWDLTADRPNGMHGLALMKGASNVRVGDTTWNLQPMFANHENGAGIFLHGRMTKDNTIFGSRIGLGNTFQDDRGNAVGIHLTEGAHGNQIGLPGNALSTWNQISYNDIGILLESGGVPMDSIPPVGTPLSPEGANVIVNNTIGSNGQENDIGIKIVQGAVMNRIGGPGDNDGNSIYSSKTAGILIEGVTHSRPELANRIVGNDFYGSGLALDTKPDPRNGDLKGAAILLTQGTSNQIIGGPNRGEGNIITTGLIGIGLENAHDNVILGNNIGGATVVYPDQGWVFEDQNRQVGIFLHNSHRNRIGPGNLVAGNGLPGGPDLGGIYLQESDGNLIVGNTLGQPEINPQSFSEGLRENSPAGITLHNSLNNRIGFPSADGGNTIGLSNGPGIHLFGNTSAGNRIENNNIGINPLGQSHPNTMSGILIENGAAGNRIDSNTIRNNGKDGININSASSFDNTITFNSISGHSSGLGIRLSGSGNDSILPPTLETVDGIDISGTTPSGTPDGSIVEFFYDPLTEGLAPIGTTTVKDEEFSFKAAFAPGQSITATLTDLNGNTSEFSPVKFIDPVDGKTLDIRRASTLREESSVATTTIPIPVMTMALTAPPEFGAIVDSMTFKASGSINELTELMGVALFWDVDADGFISSRDVLLGEVGTFGANNGQVTIEPQGSIRAGTKVNWILTAILKDNSTGAGSTLEFSLASSSVVESRAIPYGTSVLETGEFPVLSDIVTLTTGLDAFGDWRKNNFSPDKAVNDEISGPGADPDMDGIPNLLEYAMGTDPNVPDPWNESIITLTESHYVFRFPISETITGLNVSAERSYDLINWLSGEGVVDILGYTSDTSGNLYLVVEVPRPEDPSAPVYARLLIGISQN